MDETDTPQNRSNEDAESKSSDEQHSFVRKMKFGVSKILPNSLSKWLSPKVDVTSARRRRHDEIDSDDENANTNSSPLASVTDGQYQATPQLAAPPPNKKKKIFKDFLSRNTNDLYSPAATSLIGDRSNIASSTLIEDVPHRSNNQFNRFLPVENGQHASTSPIFAEDSVRDTASNYPDEASSSQSREKPINPFAINNDSSVVNFSAHLQRAKSLFTNRSYVSPRLKNYRLRNPRSSLYRSTSSLCDNNSVSSNASSAMSSPFYNGQTTFGGASATSRRMSTTLSQDMQLHHRPKVPTNLVTSRSTSALNSIGGSASMSNTAKRILDVMSKYNTPLTEVRRISNALPSIAEASALNKRKSILELDSTANDIDKTKRSLVKPNTPYNRPFGRNPVESALTTELHVPSMPELLQLKKFAANTMKIRDIASNSDSVLNKPAPTKQNEFKLTKPISNRTDGDLDESNNNKSVNSKMYSISNSVGEANKQHKNKIRSNLTKRKMGKTADDDLMPEPVNLPNITLMMAKNVEPFKLQNTDQKTSGTSDNGLQIPFKFKSANTNTPATSVSKEKQTNGNTNEAKKKIETSPSKSPFAQSNSFSSRSSSCVDSPMNSQPVHNNFKPTATATAPAPAATTKTAYIFTEPIVIKQPLNSIEMSKSNNLGRKSNYSFSEPTFVSDKSGVLAKTETPKSFANFKFESKPINRIGSDSGIETTFGSPTTKPNAVAGKDSGFNAGKTVSSASTTVKDDDTFKSLVAKQKQGKWSCKDCFASNNASDKKCACCGAANSATTSANETAATAKALQSQPTAEVDDVFKSIVAKQKQTTWSCGDCFTQNDQAQNKCVCCGGANPNASDNVTATKKIEPIKSTFSFGTLPPAGSTLTPAVPALSSSGAKTVDSTFKNIIDKQKSTWECSACLNRNDMSKSKCMCCEQSRDVTKGANEPTPAKPQISFGSNSLTAPKSSFSFGSNPSTAATTVASTFSFGNLATKTSVQSSFSFGNPKSDESKPTSSSNGKTEDDKAKEPTEKPSAQFSFGNPAVLPSTSKIETTPQPPAPVVTDNIFQSIVEKQKNSSWECSSCFTKNPNDKAECACCATPKDGSAAKDSTKKDFSLPVTSKFSFGAPPSSTFSFGSKPDNKPAFQFGSSSSSITAAPTPATATAPAPALAPVTETKPSTTTSSIFGSAPQNRLFGFPTSKPANETVVSTQAPASGFKFSFGSTSAATTSPKEVSKDVTDTGPSSTTNDKGITVLKNVLVKPATNGPNEAPKPMFSFGQSVVNKSDDDQATKAKKRSNTDLVDTNNTAKLPAVLGGSSSAFIFGQPQNTNNTFGAIVSSTATNTTQESTAPKPMFAFGQSKPLTSAFPTVQPTFSSTPLTFGASNPATTTAPSGFGTAANAPALNTPSQPIFGSNAFSSASSSLPTLGGFKPAPTFGNSTPAFGTPSPNPEAQAQATPSPAPGLFQFGASNTGVNAPISGDKPKTGGFNFSLNTAPAFNFTEQAPQQPNVPFQFGSSSDSVPNIFSVQPTATATATAIQQRRKLRPVRRVNRP